MDRIAVVTGITGQDGSYLAEQLLNRGYKVYGLKRRTSSNTLGNSEHLKGLIEVVEGDLTDLSSLTRLIQVARPTEFYNMAAQSHVGISFKEPIHTMLATGLGVTNCLEAIRLSGIHTKFITASTSEMFGGVPETAPQNEETPLLPRSPYGAAKLYGYHMVKIYRDSYRIFACNSICFNHEGPRRTDNFVTRKISLAAARIKCGLQDKLYLGNLDTKRDWGYAPDFTDGMWKILQHHEPDDYVLATGETHTIREFCEEAFKVVDLDYQKYVEVDPALLRPCEVHLLQGDSSKIRNALGWKPTVTFRELVRIMVKADLLQVEVSRNAPRL